MSDEHEFDHPPETELLHWGREEEFEEPTRIYRIDNGGAVYYLAAHDPLDAAALLRDEAIADGFDEPWEWDGFDCRRIDLGWANALGFRGDGDTSGRMASEYNRDPSRRVIACSEWAP